MTKQFIFKGVDADLQASLFEYNFIAAYNEQDKDFFIVYRNEHGNFDTGYISENSLNDLINGNDWMNDDDITSFLSYTGSIKTEWLTMPFVHKFSDLFNYYGCQNIMGTSYVEGMSETECIERYSL